jgi:hypothetical protein
MTKYQAQILRHSVKKDLSKVVRKLKNKAQVTYNFPTESKRNLPEYITNNPWY